MRALGKLFLKLMGWRAQGPLPDLPKFVLVAAPHTSNWDLPYMLAIGTVLGMRVSFMGKHTLFRPPFGWIMRFLGGISVDRRGRHGAVDQMAAIFRQRERLILAVAPEGTRSHRDHWRSGFYEIARAADIPIVLGFLDYGNKCGGLGPILHPTGDLHADMDLIRAFYEPIRGRRPRKFGPIRLKGEAELGAKPRG